MKQIKFDKCEMCPYCVTSSGERFRVGCIKTKYFCSEKYKPVIIINKIPNWCPLPNVEEKEE